MDFNNNGYFRLYFTDNISVIINDTVLGTWLIGAVLIVFAIIARSKFKNFKDVPETKFQNFVEVLVEFFDNIVVGSMDRKYAHIGNWFFGVFLFFWIANISGIFGMRAPTADLATTFAMSISTVVLMTAVGIYYSKWAYFKDLMSPFPIFLPLNILGDVSKSISLGARLFGNIFGGTIVMGMLYSMLPWFVIVLGIPGTLSIYLDIFVGTLHAYVFVVLSMTFIRLKAPMEE